MRGTQHGPVCRHVIERLVNVVLVPLDLPSATRAVRLLDILWSLDAGAGKNFVRMLRQQFRVRAAVTLYLDSVRTATATAAERLAHLASLLPDPARAKDHLCKLQELQDTRLPALLGMLCDDATADDKAAEIKKEILSRIANKPTIITTVQALLNRLHVSIMNPTLVVQLLSNIRERLAAGSRDGFAKGMELLLQAASVRPSVFSTATVLDELASFISDMDDSDAGALRCVAWRAQRAGPAPSDRRTPDDRAAICTMKLLSSVCPSTEAADRARLAKWVAGLLSQRLPRSLPTATLMLRHRRRSLQRGLRTLALGVVPKAAKYAVRTLCVALADADGSAVVALLKQLVARLELADARLPATLAAIAQIAQYAPATFAAEHQRVVTAFIMQTVLTTAWSAAGDADRGNRPAAESADWAEPSSTCRAKVAAIKVMVRHLLGLRENHATYAEPVLQLLFAVLEKDGELLAAATTPPDDRSRLRLAAGAAVLRLARVPVYAALISQARFQLLALTIQDAIYEVRREFAVKLNRGLSTLALPLGYMSVFVMSAVDPERDNVAQAKQFMQSNIRIRRALLEHSSEAKRNQVKLLPEYGLPHVIHLLAHHPDFGTGPQQLREFQRYFALYLEPIASRADNYNFLLTLVEAIKQTHDAQTPQHSEPIWVMCDLARALIHQKATTSQWVLKPFPGDVILPRQLFVLPEKPLRNQASYLPAAFVSGLLVCCAWRHRTGGPMATRHDRTARCARHLTARAARRRRCHGNAEPGGSASRRSRLYGGRSGRAIAHHVHAECCAHATPPGKRVGHEVGVRGREHGRDGARPTVRCGPLGRRLPHRLMGPPRRNAARAAKTLIKSFKEIDEDADEEGADSEGADDAELTEASDDHAGRARRRSAKKHYSYELDDTDNEEERATERRPAWTPTVTSSAKKTAESAVTAPSPPRLATRLSGADAEDTDRRKRKRLPVNVENGTLNDADGADESEPAVHRPRLHHRV